MTEFDRKSWLSLLAKAPAKELKPLWETLNVKPSHSYLRAPEQGAVMVQGRAGATGAPFNLGEMTVTRCAIKLDDGTIGHGYVQGRDNEQATTAALVDALMQTDLARTVQAVVLDPLQTKMQSRKTEKAGKAAATKVDFFTMVRGED